MAVHAGGRGPGHLARVVGAGGVDRSAYLDFVFGWPRSAYWLDGGLYDSFLDVPGASSPGGAGFAVARRGGVYVPVAADNPIIGDSGLGVWEARTNLFLNSGSPATQNITLGATGTYTITCFEAGSVSVAAGTATITGAGTATPGSPVVINCTATGTISCTVSGSPVCVNVTAGANINGPPIFTTGLAATRTAVAPQVSGLVLPSKYETSGRFKISAPPGANDYRRVFSVNDGTTNNTADVYVGPARQVVLLVRSGGSLQAQLGSRTVIPGVETEFVAKFGAADFSLKIGDQPPEVVATGAMPVGATRVQFGVNSEVATAARYLNGHIQRLTLKEAA